MHDFGHDLRCVTSTFPVKSNIASPGAVDFLDVLYVSSDHASINFIRRNDALIAVACSGLIEDHLDALFWDIKAILSHRASPLTHEILRIITVASVLTSANLYSVLLPCVAEFL